jgi:hypothetical protein
MAAIARLLAVPLLVVLLLPAAVAPTAAQSEITASSSYEVLFPDAITFHLEATATADITDVFLRYTIDRLTTVEVTSVVEMDFFEAETVDVAWTWEMKKMLGALPPGTEVDYSWRIEDASGAQVLTPWQTVVFDDDRHQWLTLEGENLNLHWYNGTRSFAQTLLDAGVEALDRLATDTGAHLAQAVDVYVYASTTDLRDALLYPQEWVGGIAFPDYGAVALGVQPNDLAWGTRAIAHEIAHLVIHQMTSNPYSGIPTWLDEGLAVYAEGDLRSDFESALDKAISDDTLISLQTLSSAFPTDTGQAMLSYAQSYSVVKFLITSYGSQNLLRLLSVFKDGSTYDGALLKVYGFDTWDLDSAWRQSLGLEPRQSPSAPPSATPTATPGKGLFGCQQASPDAHVDSHAPICFVALLLLPGLGEAVRRRHRRGRM